MPAKPGLGGITAGGGVRGLTQSLLQSGARRVLTSLWKIPDAAAVDLMTAFYERLLGGAAATTALTEAMLDVRMQRIESQQSAHPFFWAGFVLIGDPGPVAP